MTSHSAGNVYRQIEVSGSNKVQLVVMLYDGAIRSLHDATVAVDKNDIRGRALAVNKALAILGELQSTLNFDEGGEIAQSLDHMYTYLTGRILEANMKGASDGFAECVKLLQILNSAWTEVARKTDAAAVAPALVSSVVEEAPAPHGAGGAMEFFG